MLGFLTTVFAKIAKMDSNNVETFSFSKKTSVGKSGVRQSGVRQWWIHGKTKGFSFVSRDTQKVGTRFLGVPAF
jgi:hypothetical protein